MFRTIRFRLTLWYASVAALTFVFVAWTIYEYIDRILVASFDQTITKEVMWITAKLENRRNKSNINRYVLKDIEEHTSYFPTEGFIEIWDSTGSICFRTRNLESVDTLAHYVHLSRNESSFLITATNIRNHKVKLVANRSSGYTVYLAMPIDHITTTDVQLLEIFLWLGLIVLVIAVVGSVFLAKRSFSKINQVIETAQRINADRLYDRIPEQNAKDEIGKIISTFNDMISRLEVSFQQMKQFSADAAHELKTPLAVMRTQLENALNSKTTMNELKETIANCLDETIRMNNILDSLLLLAKGDAGQEIIRRESVDLGKLIRQIYDESIILASEKMIEVRLDQTTDAVVIGDEQRLRQTMLNLIDNAIKYSRNAGEINISLTKEGETAIIVVKDTGIGISEEHIPRIFDRFYRVDKSRVRALGDAGLGLSISKMIVEAHGGYISVASALNQGSVFTVTLPLKLPIE